ncbi:hypothetical protein [Caballeronia choica]|uniref:hypothetical protein n=1 Tax=Caballeronia choica TaxID=326476 RepID=UPI000A99D636|nr:hypothetical protein [Caballeronia choica]
MIVLKKVAVAMLVATLFSPAISFADWNSLRPALDDARSRLERISRSSDFDDAKFNAGRAKSALEDAESAAASIDCPMAHSELDDAATMARRARDAYDSNEFSYNVRRAIRSYNDSIDYLRLCANAKR